jgi:hypothetical protein
VARVGEHHGIAQAFSNRMPSAASGVEPGRERRIGRAVEPDPVHTHVVGEDQEHVAAGRWRSGRLGGSLHDVAHVHVAGDGSVVIAW